MKVGHKRTLSTVVPPSVSSPFSRSSEKYKTLPVKYEKEEPEQGWSVFIKDLKSFCKTLSSRRIKTSKQHSDSKTTLVRDQAQLPIEAKESKEITIEEGLVSKDASQPATIKETKESRACQDGKISDADKAWLESLETVETPLTFIDPPEEFLKLLQRFVTNNGIQKLFWSPSYDKQLQNSFIIFAERIASDLLKSLEKQVQQDFPNITVQIVNPDCVSENLGTVVVEEDCNPYHDLVQWNSTGRRATCEIILRGTQPHKDGRSSLFGVTSAHLLLSKEEMLRMENVNPQEDQHLLIREFRNKLLQRMDHHVYKLKDNHADQILHLSDHPMLAYRFFKDEKCNKPFMTDIVILQIEPGNTEKLITAIQRDHCRLTSIKRLPQNILSQMVGKVLVFAKHREGIVVTSLNHMAREGSPPLGHHISFVIIEGQPFLPGDSGSVIYTRSGENRYAIAILKERRPAPQQHIYNAILLGQAIDEIQQDYPQFVKEVRLYIPEEQEKVAKKEEEVLA